MVKGRRNRKVVPSVPGVEMCICTSCLRMLPITAFYGNGEGLHKHECKECYRERARERKKAKLAGMKRCTKCGVLKPLGEFYRLKTGYYQPTCKQCAREQARLDYRASYSTEEGRKKRLAQRAKFREKHREELAEAERQRRRKAGVPPKKRIDKAKMLKMYADGIPVPDIAKACNASEHTVRQYAAKSGIKRERADRAQVCRNCWLYPCFQGIDNLETNFALTCRSWHLRGKS